MFKILSIDGGGIRGVFPAHILQCVQERLGIDVFDYFDMIAGTSTGSIVAAGIACRKQPSEIASLYRKHGAEIFGQEAKSWWPSRMKQGVHSKYNNTNLKTVLHEEFGDTKLGDIEKPLLIPATDIGHGGVHVFKSSYSTTFTRDKNVPVKQAVLASCSAPAFFDPAKVGNYLLADGGVWANNPGLAAVIDAQYRLNINLKDIRILSLGTGQSRTAYGTDNNKDWGLMTGWKSLEFISFLLSLQAQSTQNYLQLMLGKDQLIRLDFKSDNPLPLDDATALDDLISRADRTFTHNSMELQKFFNIHKGA
ncbi:CBASS cGAMP-activated phospholipase [Pseudomonadota bacterium]